MFLWTRSEGLSKSEEMETGLLVSYTESLLIAEPISDVLVRGCGLLSSRGLALLLSDDDATSSRQVHLSDMFIE